MDQIKQFLQGTHPFEQIHHPMPHQAIMREMLSVKHLAIDSHDQKAQGKNKSTVYAPAKGWSKMCLHGHGIHEVRSYLDYEGPMIGYDKRYRWIDEIRDQIPNTMAFFETFRPFDHLRRIRLQWVEPGGYIEPHRDIEHGTDRKVFVNIAVNNPKGCELRFGDVAVPFEAGSIFMIDNTQKHSVYNASDQSRAHLIVDGR